MMFDLPKLPSSDAIALNLVLDTVRAAVMVESFFKDIGKTIRWFNTANPLLGNIKPADMLLMGRSTKLLSFIKTSLLQNER